MSDKKVPTTTINQLNKEISSLSRKILKGMGGNGPVATKAEVRRFNALTKQKRLIQERQKREK